MQKVRIKEIQPSTEDKKPTVIVDDNGARMSGFDTKLRNLKAGDLIEAELEVKGKYINIKEWKLLEEGIGSSSPTSQQSSDIIWLQIDAQARISSLTLACQLCIAVQIGLDDIETYANKYYDWLMSPGKTKPIVTPPVSTSPPTTQTDKELERGIFDKDRDPETILTLGNLFTACLEDFQLKSFEVISELGYQKKEDIGESPADCYRIIARLRNPP